MSPDDILAPFPPEVRALAEGVRALVRRVIPTATERAYPGWKAIGFRDPQAGYFCGVFPAADHVRLIFEHGARLPDPHGMLEGDQRQIRSVTIRRRSELRQPALAELLRAAVTDGSLRPSRPRR